MKLHSYLILQTAVSTSLCFDLNLHTFVCALDCKSSVNGIVNHFNDMGCSKGLDFTAGNQTMGIGVINSFLAALALVAIGILISPPIA